MTFAPYEVQKRIYEILNNDYDLKEIVTGVYDFVPDDQKFPFVVIGEADWTDRGSESTEGYSGVLTMHVWDRGRGRKTVLSIQKRIDELLHKVDPNVNGWVDISFRRDFNNVMIDPDAVTSHGVQRFKILIGGKNV